MMYVTSRYLYTFRQEFYAPLNLPLVLQDSLLAFHTLSQPSHLHQQSQPSQLHTPHIHWKLIFVYPPQCTLTKSNNRTLNWLYRKLKTRIDSSPPSQSTEELALYSTPVQKSTADSWSNQTGTRRLNIAVKGVCSNWKRPVKGVSAVMLYVPMPQPRESIGVCFMIFFLYHIIV